jgi:hypothetical protein
LRHKVAEPTVGRMPSENNEICPWQAVGS